MDFGKKRDAKKAMKLMWKEGITLKQAWKRVQGKKKSKTKSKLSPKKKRAIAKAKKAMKLKWKEGITLKQAWKKVNKFGDTVCPPGLEPNLKWTGRRGQQQCIQLCRPGLYRDPRTNRCRKVVQAAPVATPRVPLGMEINPATGRLRKICVPPKFRDSRGRCVEPRAPIVVPPGMEINPATGRLRKSCPPGKYRDSITGRCRTIRQEGLLQPLIFPSAPVLEPLIATGVRVGFGKRCSFGTCKACKMA